MSSSKKLNDKNSSGEVVNGFPSCRDLSDVVPLLTSRGLFLKPTAKVNISINLPQLKNPGKTISTWEITEKIRLLIRPDEFVSLKVSKSSLEFVRLDGDLGDKSRLRRVLARLDAQRIKIPGFSNILKVKAAEAKDDFPSRYSWDSYFRDAKHMNELKAGERPDTIHMSGLPIKWFCNEGDNVPDENLIYKIFKRWGKIRRIDVPAADPYRPRMRLENNVHKFNFEEGVFFDIFVQYIEYMDFVKAMDAFRGMKLLKKDQKNNLFAVLKVDFDKTKHMTDNSVSHREFEKKRLIAHDNLVLEKKRRKEEDDLKKLENLKKKEEKESKEKFSRRRVREEKRKRKALTVYRKREEDKVFLKIAREERKLIKAQRQLESIRLLDELFERIKVKVEKNEIDLNAKATVRETEKQTGKKDVNLDVEERNVISKKKDVKEKKSKKKKKEKKKKSSDKDHNSSDDETSETSKKKKLASIVKKNQETAIPGIINIADPWYYNPALPLLYPPIRGFRGRGHFRGGRGRGRQWNDFQHFNPHYYNEQYYKYFASLAGQDYYDDHDRRSRSRSRNRSYTPSRVKTQQKSHRRFSRSRSRSASRSRRRKRSRSSKRSRSTSRSSSRSDSRSRSRSRSRRSSSCRKNYDKRSKRRFSRSPSHVKVTRAKSRINTPKRKSRSSSWSLPKSPSQRSDSWSKAVGDNEKQSSNKPEQKSQEKDSKIETMEISKEKNSSSKDNENESKKTSE